MPEPAKAPPLRKLSRPSALSHWERARLLPLATRARTLLLQTTRCWRKTNRMAAPEANQMQEQNRRDLKNVARNCAVTGVSLRAVQTPFARMPLRRWGNVLFSLGALNT